MPLEVEIEPRMSPGIKLVVYYIREDGEIVARGSYKELLIGTSRFSSTLRSVFKGIKSFEVVTIKQHLKIRKGNFTTQKTQRIPN